MAFVILSSISIFAVVVLSSKLFKIMDVFFKDMREINEHEDGSDAYPYSFVDSQIRKEQ